MTTNLLLCDAYFQWWEKTQHHLNVIRLEDTMMKVRSNDGQEFEIDHGIARQSTLLNSFFDGISSMKLFHCPK